MKSNLKLLTLLDLVDEPNRESCVALFHDNRTRIINAPGSQTKHQAWEGGYLDHEEQVMNLAIDLYSLLPEKVREEFSISDAIIVLFLHDIEKPFKYIEPRTEFRNDKDKMSFLKKMVQRYKFQLTKTHWNALKYVHGEGSDYHPTKRVQGRLAGFCHCCDNMSARVLFDYPQR